MNFQQVEKKWQKRWSKAKIFEPKTDLKKKKYFFTVPYPYISGSLHIGHSRVVIDGDIHCRYMKMVGNNVLFPMAFHITGTPVLGISAAIESGVKKTIELYKDYVRNYVKDEKKVGKIVQSFKEPWKIVEFFIPKMMDEFSSLGLGVDWTRRFNTGEPDYQKMIEWQFHKYKEFGYLTQGAYPVLYCINDKNAVGEDDIKDGDSDPVEKHEFTLLKFKMPASEKRFLVAATLRPETVFGQTNLWVRPETEYVVIKVKGEEWILSKQAAEKLAAQREKIEVVDKINSAELIGVYVRAPGINRDIIVLPSDFVELDFASGIVTSVPSDAPYDWITLQDLQRNYEQMEKYKLNPEEIQKIEPIAIIKTEEFGDMAAQRVCKQMKIESQTDKKLEQATQIVYKAGFHTGRMNENCGKYAGMQVSQAKELVKKEMLENKDADIFYETSRHAVCRCGGRVIVKILDDQWFIDFNSTGWKKKAHDCLAKISIQPERYRKSFEDTFAWLDKRPVARRRGIGTPLPFDRRWIIESLSDSTIYMTFYTIKDLINRFKIKPKQMTLSFFDYVYLGKGDIKKISRETKIPTKQLKELRKAFDYWYPNDHRHTYPLHLPNHLSFFIFAHAAIFPEKYWPKKISFHGMIECGGEKMSKSRGNVITLLDVKNKFGADVFRAYLATATSVEGDFNWITEDVNAMKKTVANLYEILEKAAKVRGTGKTDMLGNAFISKFEGWIEAATKNIAEMKHREYSNIVIYDITNAYKKLLKGADKNEIKAVNAAVIEKWIKLLCPVMPHIAEELWSKLGKTNLVSAESWPVADKKKIDKKLESAEMMIDKVSEDINNIVKLVGKKPKSIELFIAPEWKFGLFRIVAKNLAEGKRDVKIIIGEAMKDSEVKKHGQDAAKIIPRLASEPGKIPGVILGEREEIKLLASMQKVLEKEFSCKFKIMAAGKSHEEKAMQALPGKPAIVVRT